MRELPLFLAVGAVTIAAAVADLRDRRIPDVLTLPIVVAAPLVRGFFDGAPGVIAATGGVVLTALAPALLWRAKAMGAGDVKLAAAIGGLAGVTLGVEIVIAALFFVCVHAIGVALVRGELRGLLSDGWLAARLAIRRSKDAAGAAPREWRALPFAPYVAGSTLLALALEALE